MADRETRAPYPARARLTEAVVRGARERGVLVYSGTGNADGTNGDTILLGPPFVVTDDELGRIVEVLAEVIPAGGRRAGLAAATAASPTPAEAPDQEGRAEADDAGSAGSARRRPGWPCSRRRSAPAARRTRAASRARRR